MGSHRHVGDLHREPIMPRPLALKLLRQVIGKEVLQFRTIRERLSHHPRVRALREGGNDTIGGVFRRTLQQHAPGCAAYLGTPVFERIQRGRSTFWAVRL